MFALLLSIVHYNTCFGFSLLGPFADWMDITNGNRMPGDIGGAVNINEGYRWNVPVVTYGFDQSFLDYFGTNGVAAVEAAFQMLNDLPAASDIALTNFPPYVLRYNYQAQAQQLTDLKTAALVLILEHLGLAPPTRHIFDLRRFDPIFYSNPDESSWPTGTIPDLILERNFDPETFTPSHVVNTTSNSAYVATGYVDGTPNCSDVVEYQIDPDNSVQFPAVADHEGGNTPEDLAGVYALSLTADDVGGLRYLLRSNNISAEVLLPDVHGAGTNAGSLVNLALRPGVEKITFMRQAYDSLLGQFVPMTNQYTDTYITNGVVMHQGLERVTAEPDFLFSLADLQTLTPGERGWDRTGASNWWNSAMAAGSTNGGPGIIRPPVHITLDTRGEYVTTIDSRNAGNSDYRWGSYDGSPNPPVAYPQAGWADTSKPMTVHFSLLGKNGRVHARFDLLAPVPIGGHVVLQTSTDLAHWSDVTQLDPIENDGEALTWDNVCYSSQMFFRVLLE